MVRISTCHKSKPLLRSIIRSLDCKCNFCQFLFKVGRHLQSWYAWRTREWAPEMCDMWSVSHQEMLKMSNWMVLFKVRSLWNELQFFLKPLDPLFHFWVVPKGALLCDYSGRGGGSSWRGTTDKDGRLRWKFLSCEIPRRWRILQSPEIEIFLNIFHLIPQSRKPWNCPQPRVLSNYRFNV